MEAFTFNFTLFSSKTYPIAFIPSKLLQATDGTLLSFFPSFPAMAMKESLTKTIPSFSISLSLSLEMFIGPKRNVCVTIS